MQHFIDAVYYSASEGPRAGAINCFISLIRNTPHTVLNNYNRRIFPSFPTVYLRAAAFSGPRISVSDGCQSHGTRPETRQNGNQSRDPATESPNHRIFFVAHRPHTERRSPSPVSQIAAWRSMHSFSHSTITQPGGCPVSCISCPTVRRWTMIIEFPKLP
jgi:hypothetical protein